MKKKNRLKLCIDRVIPLHLRIEAARNAITEYAKNEPKIRTFLSGVSVDPLKLALFTGKIWKSGRILGVEFLDGTPIQKKKVMKYAQLWCDYANVIFDFSVRSGAEIRISFNADPTSWSAVGTDCLLTNAFPKNKPTMNFGWLNNNSKDEEDRRVVLHEFGHALGAIHEHQNPEGGIKWNLPAVYKYFSGPPNHWSKEKININVVGKYSIDQLNATKFDSHSIMLYSFPPELVDGGTSMIRNTTLSSGDKKFIGIMYPKNKRG